jgi:dTDP-4-amino-4,6-dideoxygalactose transaminase
MIRVFKPSMDEEEVEAVREVLLSGWIGLGPKTRDFESAFAEYVGTAHAVAVNSATSALDLSLRLLEIGPGDEVIIPSMTFVSTAHAVHYNGAVPVFADVDPDTLNISVDDVARKLTARTRAVVPVHFAGRPVDMDWLSDVTDGVPLVEDAAHACGSTYHGKRAGALGAVGCFSFHAVKNLAVGDGGAITVDDPEYAARVKRLRLLGIDRDTWSRTGHDQSYWWEYQVREIGLKCHMNDIAAAIGLVQLRKLEKSNARRAEIARIYNAAFEDDEFVRPPIPLASDTSSSWHMYIVRARSRNDLSVFLQERGIATGVHYKPIHLYECYGPQPALPNAEQAFEEILTLPMYPDLTNEEVEHVVSCIKDFYGSH